MRYRLVLLALALLGSALPARAASPPTVRLLATREGLVGRTTASGHLIVPDDHFVALPSRKALGKTVVVTYRGKSISAPVLDIGPWNRDDAWWETGSARGQFADLPRFVPEVWAAYDQGYNNGKDAIGRFITYPAMIDLADGLYADLGMTQADWVDVTLTWIDAPSPPPLVPADRRIAKKTDPNPPPAPAPAPVAAPPVPAPPVTHDTRYFSETGYRIDNDAIWGYFTARGRVPVFGFPVSRPFVLLGCDVQVFQRQIAQACAGRGVTLMNLLDPEIFPYERVNGSVLPGPDLGMKAETPAVGSEGYGSAIIEFVRDNAPDSFESLAVGFGKTFFAAVAAPDNPLIDLEIWGAPISRPRRDPMNDNFVYQRFQRGIMHFDATSGRTQGLLLADYVKAILRARDLPADLAEAARGSKYFNQYCPEASRWVCRPNDLAATDLSFAFEKG